MLKINEKCSRNGDFNTISWWFLIVAYFFGPPCTYIEHKTLKTLKNLRIKFTKNKNKREVKADSCAVAAKLAHVVEDKRDASAEEILQPAKAAEPAAPVELAEATIVAQLPHVEPTERAFAEAVVEQREQSGPPDELLPADTAQKPAAAAAARIQEQSILELVQPLASAAAEAECTGNASVDHLERTTKVPGPR